MKNSTLYANVISDDNIYKAIYSLESYVFEKELLDKDDVILYSQLGDKYNDKLIREIINECRNTIIKIIDDKNDFFNVSVFFKPKKINSDTKEIEFRPIHVADLKTQICIVAMLTPLIFDDSSGMRKLSEISRLLPSNYYGNIPSTDVINFFKPWGKQYKEYSEKAIKAQRDYCETKKFTNEVNLDIKTFFPSINPEWIYNLIMSKYPVSYNENDIECLKIILEKLLFFNLNILDDSLVLYYPKSNVEQIRKSKHLYNIGIPQGLPQSYFFGNLCMTFISSEIDKIFEGDAYYYVDDSIIYTNSIKEEFDSNIEQLNKNINTFCKTISAPGFENEIITKFNNKIKYEMCIHEKGKKSSICEIKQDFSLFLFSKPASATNFELFVSLDELEDASLKKKMESILSIIDYRLKQTDNKGNTSEDNNKKLLQRYKKFYTNRLNILKIRETNEVNVAEFFKKYGLNDDNDIEKFIDALEDDVFSVESKLVIKQLSVNPEMIKDIINTVRIFEFKMYQGKIVHYYSKVLATCESYLFQKDCKYESIESEIACGIESFNKVNSDVKVESLEKIIRSLNYLVSNEK